MNKILLLLGIVFIAGLIAGYIPAIASPGPAKPNPGHSWNEIECDNNLCVDVANGKVGIGTTNPQAKLHVKGGWLKVGDDGSAANSIQLETQSGFHRIAFKDLRFWDWDDATDIIRFNDGTLELGPNVAGKEVNAGKIGYQKWTSDALDIVGAGTSTGARKVKLWDNVDIPGDLTVGGSIKGFNFGPSVSYSGEVDLEGGKATGIFFDVPSDWVGKLVSVSFRVTLCTKDCTYNAPDNIQYALIQVGVGSGFQCLERHLISWWGRHDAYYSSTDYYYYHLLCPVEFYDDVIGLYIDNFDGTSQTYKYGISIYLVE